MTAPAVHEVLRLAGLTLALTPERGLKVTPASRLTPELRELIRANKAELIAWQTQTELASRNAPTAVAESGSVLTLLAPQSIAPDEPTAQATADPDSWYWPNSSAMNTAEIATFTARVHLFSSRSVNLEEAQAMADKQVLRDRELDERRLCFECQHLQAKPAYLGCSWPDLRCGNWKASGLCISVLNSGLSEDFAHKLQRCTGFKVAML